MICQAKTKDKKDGTDEEKHPEDSIKRRKLEEDGCKAADGKTAVPQRARCSQPRFPGQLAVSGDRQETRIDLRDE